MIRFSAVLMCPLVNGSTMRARCETVNGRYVFNMCRETNLKVRQALVETAEMGDDIEQLSAFDGITFIFLLKLTLM